MSGESKYWFNSSTGEVEYGLESPSIDRIGPFDTAEEAARAPEVLQERAKAWADEDAAEDNWGADGAR
ncbi:SPOR domain-containing protein [Microbacterium sp. Au-Mic1]|uniref:SPOR domain-containing protein n=1 Tax=Microbacterium sp. Au-Mic1 TaxID=2906457 RepID=UPI001E2DC9F1|nr:SPOR domain-containing protein [Microbacterium sp. Au-Mic1]MCE4025134.1 SPOR domain-containing protein [Microbacterium sp. Au-Mic1]